MHQQLINKGNFDLNQKKTFFEPHPGFLGAAIPLPKTIKSAVDSLNRQTMPLREALEKIKQAAGQLPIKLVVDGGTKTNIGNGCLFLYITTKDGNIIHAFRLIRFCSS